MEGTASLAINMAGKAGGRYSIPSHKYIAGMAGGRYSIPSDKYIAGMAGGRYVIPNPKYSRYGWWKVQHP